MLQIMQCKKALMKKQTVRKSCSTCVSSLFGNSSFYINNTQFASKKSIIKKGAHPNHHHSGILGTLGGHAKVRLKS